MQDFYINNLDGLANCTSRSPGTYTFSMSFGKAIFFNDVRHSMWANRQLLDGCAAISAGELERDLRISHNNVLGTLNPYLRRRKGLASLLADYCGLRNLAAAAGSVIATGSGCA